jgi:hypothetical protein
MLYFCGAEALFAVLFDAEADVVGESYIETAGAAGEDVDVEVIFPLRHVRRITEEAEVGKQIPPLRCGMTNKEASARAKTTATATADSSASLRNDKQENGRQQRGMTNM